MSGDDQPKLRRLDIEHMLRTDPPPVQWLADPLLVRGAVTMLAGREGHGKSMLALAIAAAIGSGETVAGIACNQGRTLVIDSENGADEVHRRVRTLCVKPDTLTYVVAEGFDLDADRPLLHEHVVKCQPDLLVLDSLRSLAPELEENYSAPAEAILQPLRSLARQHDCAVLILHHDGKANDGYRGSTAIGAAVELGFTLTREGNGPGARRRLTCWKCRVAPEPETRWLTFDARDGRVAIVEAAPADAGPEDSAQAVLAQRFGDVLAEQGPLSWGELCERCGADPESGTSKRAREQAADARTLVRLRRGVCGPPDDPSVQSDRAAGRSAPEPSGRPAPQVVAAGRTDGRERPRKA